MDLYEQDHDRFYPLRGIMELVVKEQSERKEKFCFLLLNDCGCEIGVHDEENLTTKDNC